MPGERYPRLGDVLIVYPYADKDKYKRRHRDTGNLGLVSEIELDQWGHQIKVKVVWQSQPAPNYNSCHGFAGVNIHNLRDCFRVFRNGVEIL